MIQSIEIRPQKSATRATFCLLPLGPTGFDLTWLGVYLLVYLPIMLALKFSLRLP